MKLYLDDLRTPVEKDWTVVRNYDEFVDVVKEIGIENIDLISFDHDLGDTAMMEYFNNVANNYTLDYSNIQEKTGMDCVKWLINHFYDKFPDRLEWTRSECKKNPPKFPRITVHSANPIGSANIMGYVNNFLMNEGQPQSCVRALWEHTVKD